MQHVHRPQFRPDLFEASFIKKSVEPGARIQAHVVPALWANLQPAVEICTIEDGTAVVALAPQPLRHPATSRNRGDVFYLRRDQSVKPTHALSFSLNDRVVCISQAQTAWQNALIFSPLFRPGSTSTPVLTSTAHAAD